MTRTVRLYLGAHKTASTHLQHMLMNSADLVARHGTRMAEPLTLRVSGWMTAFFQAARQHQSGEIAPALLAQLRAQLPEDGGDLMLTDENILGTPREMLEGWGVYAFAGRRLKTLAAIFHDCRVEAFMSMRSYDSFFASLYAEVVRNRGYVSFDPFQTLSQEDGWSWQNTVGDLVEASGAENVVVWDYADFRALIPELVVRLSGVADSAPIIAAYPSRPTRPSLSQPAMDIIKSLAPAVGAAAALSLTEKLATHYSVENGAPRFEPFTSEQHDAMQQRYRTDIAAITSRWPALTMLRPDAAGMARTG